MTSFLDLVNDLHECSDAQAVYLEAVNIPLINADAPDVRQAASTYMAAGDYQRAALVWGRLLHSFPERAPLMRSVLRCIVEAKDSTWLSVCIPKGSLSKSIISEISSPLHEYLEKLWKDPSPANAVLQNALLWNASMDDVARVLILQHLTQEQGLDSIRVRLEDADLTVRDAMTAAHVFDSAQLVQGAKMAFDHAYAAEENLSFEDTLLGCRIYAQSTDKETFSYWRARCLAFVDTAPDECLAFVDTAPDEIKTSYLFHLMFPKLTSASRMQSIVKSTLEDLDYGTLTLDQLWNTAKAVATDDTVAKFLRHMADSSTDDTQARALDALADVTDQSMDTMQIAAHCAGHTWGDSTLIIMLLEQCIDDAIAADQLNAIIEVLTPLSPQVLTMLRARVAQARTVGNNKLASEIWVAILTLNPSDELAYMNALTTLNLAGEIGQAQKLAQQWDTSKLNGYVLAFGGMALARLGMGHKAKELLLRAASEEGVEGWPTNHLRTLAQGLILYGRYDLARRFFPTEPQDQIKADCAIVDPGHSDGPGHHATYNIFFSEFIEAAEGSLPTVAINRDCGDETLKGYRPNRQTIFQPYAYNNMALGTAEIIGLNASFSAEMAYIFEDHLPQTLIVHSMRSIMLGGFVDWLETLEDRRPQAVIIGIIEADHLTNKTSSNLFSKALKTSLKKMSKLKIDNLILFAETAQAVDWLQKRIPKTPVHKLAYLAAGRAVVARTPNRDERTQAPIFGITGGTRVERGFEYIFKAILTSKSQTEKWCVQVDQEAFTTFGRDPLYSIEHVKARAADRVTLLKGSLTDAEYYEALGALDCLVLPYSGRYAVSGSGVLYEAIYSRKYIIVSGGSTLASELKELGYPHRLIDMKDPDSVMKAVAQTQAEWPDITAQIAQFFANEPTLPLETFQTLYTQGKQAKANKSDENFRERISAFLLSIMDRRAKKTDK